MGTRVENPDAAGPSTFGRPGVYNKEYFTGAQTALYIGDILVDEVVRLEFVARQTKRPIYGYASQLWDDVSKGQFVVQGSFTVNFKEAGYLWLVLNHYKEINEGPEASKLGGRTDLGNFSPFQPGDGKQQRESTTKNNIERIVNGEVGVDDTRRALLGLLGYASGSRASGTPGLAENIFETFENYIWGAKKTGSKYGDVRNNRRPDDNDLQGFDIYVAFGDYVGDDNINHTVQMLMDVHILSSHKVVDITGDPILESYEFIARELI